MAEVCADCGSKVSYRQVDVSTVEDEGRVFMQVAFACTNARCLNADPRNHSFEWVTTVEGKA